MCFIGLRTETLLVTDVADVFNVISLASAFAASKAIAFDTISPNFVEYDCNNCSRKMLLVIPLINWARKNRSATDAPHAHSLISALNVATNSETD